MSKGGSWDNPFGGLLDFNGDGKEDMAEQYFGYKIFEDCISEDALDTTSFDDFEDCDEEEY